MLAPSGALAIHGVAGDAAAVRSAFVADARVEALTISEQPCDPERVVQTLQRRSP
jgi:hypothetical protein